MDDGKKHLQAFSCLLRQSNDDVGVARGTTEIQEMDIRQGGVSKSGDFVKEVGGGYQHDPRHNDSQQQ